MEDFKGKKILICGASRGIGYALALKLMEHGAFLILHAASDIGISKLKTKFKNSDVKFWQADFSNPNDIIETLDTILSSIGALDGFVNCVGMRLRRPLKQLNPNILQRAFNTNVVSYFEIMRFITQKRRYNPGLSIISISSISVHAGSLGVSGYAATKGAIESATKSLAKELHKKSIRVNTIVCGQVNTEEYQTIIKNNGNEPDKILDRQYMGLLEPEAIANTCLYLLSDQSNFISGTSFPADAGYLH